MKKKKVLNKFYRLESLNWKGGWDMLRVTPQKFSLFFDVRNDGDNHFLRIVETNGKKRKTIFQNFSDGEIQELNG